MLQGVSVSMCVRSVSPFKLEGRSSLENTLFHSHAHTHSCPSLCARSSRKVDLCQVARVFTVTETSSNTAETERKSRRGEGLSRRQSAAMCDAIHANTRSETKLFLQNKSNSDTPITKNTTHMQRYHAAGVQASSDVGPQFEWEEVCGWRSRFHPKLITIWPKNTKIPHQFALPWPPRAHSFPFPSTSAPPSRNAETKLHLLPLLSSGVIVFRPSFTGGVSITLENTQIEITNIFFLKAWWKQDYFALVKIRTTGHMTHQNESHLLLQEMAGEDECHLPEHNVKEILEFVLEGAISRGRNTLAILKVISDKCPQSHQLRPSVVRCKVCSGAF